MKRAAIWIYMGTLTSLGIAPVMAQRTAVPNLVQYSGTLPEFAGKPVVGVTFALYRDEQGGSPIWMETQNVSPDAGGRYIVLLGATRNQGLPTQLFAAGEARWLGVQAEGRPEEPRVVLLSVPYALKAADADTIGGLPPSAFLMAAASTGTAPDHPAAAYDPAVQPALSGSGTLDFVPLWTPNGTTLGNSILFQSSSSDIGVGTQSPGAKLDVAGSAKVRGPLLLPATGAATAGTGKNSQPLNMAASAFNSSTAAAANQTFTWQAEPSGNNTTSPSGTLNLLFGANGGPATETGLHISSKGLFSFAAGQSFPGTGTITGVTAGTDLTGGGSSGNVTLNMDTTKVPQLSGANHFTANQSVTGNLSATGSISAGTLSGNGAGVTNVNAALLNGNPSSSFALLSGPNTFPASQVFNGNGLQMIVGDPGCGAGFAGITFGALSNCTYSLIGDGANTYLNAPDVNGSIFLRLGNLELMSVSLFDFFVGTDLSVAGDLDVTGKITAGTKDFRIDHPLDPANKYLYHASVESSEMMNIYTGNVILDGNGAASVQLPEWFEALNGDFRYQLTAIGAAAPNLHIAQKVTNHQFNVAGGVPGMEVSWQVAGVRHDAFAQAHPLLVEVEKPADEQGRYLHPALYGQPDEKQIRRGRNPAHMQ